ncbi:Beta-lactamase domain-containing protein 2 [Colletotrichum sidae]|uniref:Beta-lactamase domain-containing protein 2 n=1 Tax=Colletotrichum sidae TaxID=1347389 RepID=A0A4R8TLS1_9PEZI|nr:Beta-lactamase domain-containing protein 2 [Colletotrichum sidae]
MAQIHGTCDAKFEGVRAKFQEFVASGFEVGASLTVTIDGQDAVNIWGGYADAGRTRPWNEDTIVNVFSTTKTICALAVLLLINEGKLSANDRVAKHWPEFAANGKEDVEIRHLLSHTSGLAVFEDPITMAEMCDVELVTSRLEKQRPRWTPGTASGYHAWTYGYPIQEVVRRITGLGFRDFVAARIAGPLGADFQIGAREEDWRRVSDVIPPPPFELPDPATMPPADSLPAKMLNPIPDAGFANSSTWRRAEVASANGHTNAKGLATIWSNALTIPDESRRLLSKETIDVIFQEQSYGPDLVYGATVRFGTGLSIRGNGDAIIDSWIPKGRLCYWGGWGGSTVINDIDRSITICYAMNKMESGTVGNTAFRAYVAEIYKALGVSIP